MMVRVINILRVIMVFRDIRVTIVIGAITVFMINLSV